MTDLKQDKRPYSILLGKGFLTMVVLVIAGVLLTACGSSGGDDTASEDPGIQLVYQDWRSEWFPPMAQRMLEQFHAENPGIRVFYTPDPQGFSQTMLADIQAGTAPDVFWGCCTFFPIWAQQGFAVDLTPFSEADLERGIIDEWDEAQYSSFLTEDGRRYALPKYHGALALYYNKDIFDEYGVDYPDETWDHDDYMDAMQRLTHDLDGNGETDLWGSMIDISWDRIQVHVNSWGGNFVDPADPTRCAMDEPESLEALEWLRARMWDDGVMATPLDVQNLDTRTAFSSGKIAMVEDGSWALKYILTNADFRVGVAPLPGGPEGRVTLATTDGYAIYSRTNHPEAAWKLLKFLVSKDYGRAMARANFLQPARASLVDEWVGYIREEFPEKSKDVDIAAFADGHIKGYSVTAEVFPNMGDATPIAYDAWDQILTFGQAPAEEMVSACRQIEESQRTDPTN